MYHPYFRGKQYELITIRENAALMAASDFIPIIEPVKESLGGLEKALKSLCEAEAQAVIIVNPHHGVHAEDGKSISAMLAGFMDKPDMAAGVMLKKNMTVAEAVACYAEHQDHTLYFVHAGFTDAKILAEALGQNLEKTRHIFFEPHCGKLYQKHFSGCHRVLLRDGFKVRRNRDHPPVEFFSDLHLTFQEESVDGFGDFLTVGDAYSEGGGPAYAVAIHLTFIDPEKDDAMYLYHFVSDSKDTPTDPAGKFAEALESMIATIDAPGSKVLETEAVTEFRDLHAKKHFPGLGYVKKLSMKHHIETMSKFFRSE